MNNIVEEYLKSPEALVASIKAHRSVLKRYVLSLNGNNLNPDSAILFLKNLKGPSIPSLGTYEAILERFLSWHFGYKIKLDCPWIAGPLKEYMREYRSSIYVRDRRRESCVGIIRDGKLISIKGKKRSYPNNVCELCNKQVGRLNYHHWDDGNLMRGMWLCQLCHMRVAEFIDKNGLGRVLRLIEEYVRFKIDIDLACDLVCGGNEQH